MGLCFFIWLIIFSQWWHQQLQGYPIDDIGWIHHSSWGDYYYLQINTNLKFLRVSLVEQKLLTWSGALVFTAPHTLVSFGAPVFNPVIQYSFLFSVECFVYHWISSQPFGQYMFCLSINTSDYPFSIFIILLCNPFLGDSPIIHDVS